MGSVTSNRNRHRPIQLVVKPSKDRNVDLPIVLLEDQPSQEHKHLLLVDRLGDEDIGGGDESNVQVAFQVKMISVIEINEKKKTKKEKKTAMHEIGRLRALKKRKEKGDKREKGKR
ncbi:hypothetical protein Syun_001695 [Stephania yunnanensis]|uniref:Uncharacterized protein n=1 Tax=Stephania yunnanensis TaxID=152371 RepID=A0AAP0Q6P6_9MAGN